MDWVVVHYDEIGLKKGNRAQFENKLVETIKNVTGCDVKKEYGQIVVDVKGKKLGSIKEKLLMIPGVAYFSFADRCDLDINSINALALKILKDKKGTFRITTKRSNKNFSMDSNEVSRDIGAHIVDRKQICLPIT
jgi:thiamine biosynthesis protein ThiI